MKMNKIIKEMKKYICIVALTILSVIGVKAQTPTTLPTEMANDSISVLFQHLARTNAEIAYINENVRLHSQIALGSFAMEGIGVACLLATSSNLSNGFSEMEPMAKLGCCLCVAGGIGFLCSYIPIWTSKVRLDERGLIIPLN